MTFTPANLVANRTARLVAESKTPVYSTLTPTKREQEIALMVKAERVACGEDFCHICSRCTDHFAEHSDEQILRWANSPLGKRLLRFV